MYLPFLRAKQYEIIALRDLSAILAENNTLVSPILEPVRPLEKSYLSSFCKLFEECKKGNINFTLVVNPSVSSNAPSIESIIDMINTHLAEYDNFQIGILVEREKKMDELHKKIANNLKMENIGISFIHQNSILEDFSLLGNLEQEFGDAKFNVVNFSEVPRIYRRKLSPSTLVSLVDGFDKKATNVEYLKKDNEFFSEEYLYLEQEGYIGCSDFLTIGKEYSDGGFLPKAVSIHLTYENKSQENSIWVAHFTSDSNQDTSDIAGKFMEALKKLVDWTNAGNTLKTQAISEFQDLYKRQHFPGLGVLKKLSMMHHIELMIELLKNKK